MKVLINERLSKHKYKTPEGYLICQDAILARTGKQTYTRGDVFGQDTRDADSDIEIDRKYEEVFSPKTLASFENKPVTVEHPDEDVNVENYKDYAVGFVRDVKQGKTENGEDVILGTLVITDAQTIKEIEDGEHTELSCGYDCDIEDEENPQQRNIRGNHVALCEHGRAGIAKIVDSIENKLSAKDSLTIRELSDLIKTVENYMDKASHDSDGRMYKRLSEIRKELISLGNLTRDSIKDIHRIYLYYLVSAGGAHVDNRGRLRYDGGEDSYKLYESIEEARKDLDTYQRKLGVKLYIEKDIFLDDSIKDSVKLSLSQQQKVDRYIDKLELDEQKVMAEINRRYEKNRGGDLNWIIDDVIDDIIKNPRMYDSINDDKPFSASQIASELKIDTNNFSQKDGEFYYGYEEEANHAMKALKSHGYNVDVHTENDRRGLTGIKYVVEFSKTKQFDSIKDVDPREGESKDEFIARFMSETKSEYPDEKQRLAVANSYWERKGRDSVKDGRNDDYFGQEKYEKYGEKVYRALRGKTISKRRDLAEESGGIVYEARKLGMTWQDLLECLEGMCYNGKAEELYPGDSYKIKDSIKDSYTPSEIIDILRRQSVGMDENLEIGEERNGWFAQIQNVGKATYENVAKYPNVSPKLSSWAWGRIWKDGKIKFNEKATLNELKQKMIKFLSIQANDSINDEAKYVVWAKGTEEGPRALYRTATGNAQYCNGADAHKFSEAEAIKFTKQRGKYEWVMKKVQDSVKDAEKKKYEFVSFVKGGEAYNIQEGYTIEEAFKNYTKYWGPENSDSKAKKRWLDKYIEIYTYKPHKELFRGGISRLIQIMPNLVEKEKEMSKDSIKDETKAEMIKKAQTWVDYDMKKYGKVSQDTKDDIKALGLRVVDLGGEFEVRDSLKKYEIHYEDGKNIHINIVRAGSLKDVITKAKDDISDKYKN